MLMKNNKAAGSDGLASEFYKTFYIFWDIYLIHKMFQSHI